MSKRPITITAVGDISFTGGSINHPNTVVFQQVKEIFKNRDLVIGNLEGPLTICTEGLPDKCNLRGDPGWAEVLKSAGFNLLSLANNHIMDYGSKGLLETMELLEVIGIRWVGAGRNIKEANSPIFLNIEERKLAILARNMVIVSSPIHATDNLPGVAIFDEEQLIKNINEVRKIADLVILILHWGLEDYHYPAPRQRKLVKKLVKNGVDIIIGHHPHVLQGIERVGNGIVAYSLGNFLFNDFEWTYRKNSESEKKYQFKLSENNRTGIIFNLKLDATNHIHYDVIFTKISESNIQIPPDQRKFGYSVKLVNYFLRVPLYSLIWKFYAVHREWKIRLSKRYNFKNVLKKIFHLRLVHVKEFLTNLKKATQIASEKTTNPYE